MQASARKMKRTKREQLIQVESMNRNGIGQLMMQFNQMLAEIIKLQKNQLALVQALKRRGLIDDLMIRNELSTIEEMEQMNSKALIIDPNKKGP
ncbi:hypothetical protein A2Z67_00025 [Candidatus Woesebacteria bacterium RBG_13_36_22]|uniref:Uncharacterized protein n=1 Tax=Candidatus Woesebacteria bacterium RBG_13_36_22 TaxID=1802478 RepID=A0A1F7X6H9_9BACT|nr:MAG: hypothetical protein A2Z67_00025 [Candidatus Woesebacteria bacterium RBG_13_36_22]